MKNRESLSIQQSRYKWKFVSLLKGLHFTDEKARLREDKYLSKITQPDDKRAKNGADGS